MLATLIGMEKLGGFSMLNIAKSISIFLTVLLLDIVRYRLLSPSHPLHGIPGPVSAKLSQLWLFHKVVRGQVRHDMQKVHARYGDIVRIGECPPPKTERLDLR